jgi:ABC-type sugar transport system ATPase subunit/ribose/xylose/arabinose/galactoside ABC-type transport system permease subunit
MTEAVIHRGAGASDVPRGGGDHEDELSAVAPHEPLPAVELVGISKIFGSTVAVKNVSFELFPGEVLALVGENGAGKSTLVKTVGGVYRPDEGFLRVAGERVELHSPLDAQHCGIAVVHQHPGLFPDLSIAENVFAGQPIRGAAGLLDHGKMRAEAQKWIDVLGLRRDAGTLVSSLRTSEQQMVEIARALAADAKVLILDEPTAALTIGEVEKLFAVIDQLRTRGVAMMFVGHRMEEIFAVSDRIAILRDGTLIDTRITAQTDQAETVKLMVGRALGDLYPRHHAAIGSPVLTVENLSVAGSFKDVGFTVRAGEVVGLAGLVGSGRTEIARVIFGIDKPTTGSLTLGDETIRPRSAADAMAHGIAYVSEDRRGQSVIEDFSILDNATLPVITKATTFGMVRRRLELALVSTSLERMKLKFARFDQPIGTLSGGNQQKVVLAKWLATNPRLLILDEPTQGIDIQAKAEVHRIVSELAEQGLAILLISSDMPELIGACDRIMVMRHGEIVAEFDRENASQYEIGLAATGVTAPTAGEPDLDETNPVGPSAQALEHLVESEHQPSPATGSSTAQVAPAKPADRAAPAGEPPPTKPQREWLKRLLGRRETGLLIALLVIIVPLSILNPRFLSAANLVDLMLVETSLIGIVAIGQLMVMLTRQIDLSVASIIGLTGYIAASTMAANPGLPVFVGILIACGVGLLCGAINGVIVAYGRVPSIVVTLGTLAIYRGVDSILSAGKQVGSADVPDGWLAFTAAKPLGMSILIWIGLIVFLIAGGFLWKTSRGREIYATGSNPDGARLIGIPAQRRVLLAFCASGLLAGFAGALWASHYTIVDGQLALGVELTVIAAVVVGGVSMRGGSGTVLGAVIGTFALLVIKNALALAKVDPQYLQAFYGAAILLAITVDRIIARRARRTGKVQA